MAPARAMSTLPYGGVADEDAAPRARFDVDVVDTDSGAPHDGEPRRMIQKLAGDRGPEWVISPS
jgi:hypothetical protein